jgi:hypothetical protein
MNLITSTCSSSTFISRGSAFSADSQGSTTVTAATRGSFTVAAEFIVADLVTAVKDLVVKVVKAEAVVR